MQQDEPSPERLRRIRRLRRTAGILLIVGIVGVAAVGVSRREPTEATGPGRSPPRGALPRPHPPRPLPDPTPAIARGPTSPLRIFVVSKGAPAAGVHVRVIEHDAVRSTDRTCASGKTTDTAGSVTLDVEDGARPDALVELAKADGGGLRHGFVALSRLREEARAAPRGVATAALPDGGSLRVVLAGLDPAARPKTISVTMSPPYGEWLSLFSDLAAVPAADGGLAECGAIPATYTFAVGEDGVAVVPHVPGDHAISVGFARWPDGYLVASATSTSPLVPAVDGEVLRVPEGTDAVYRLTWKHLPEARVHVLDGAGVALVGARVAVGIEHGEGKPRLFDAVAVTDASGLASVALWTGSRLPEWAPHATLVAATASGKKARVLRSAGGWYGVDLEVRLEPAVPGSFAVEGRLSFPKGRPVQGVPILLATADPWNGHVAAPPLSGTTGTDGAFRIAVPEELREIFGFGEGVRIELDGDRLEGMRADAMWRSLWPGLSRAKVTGQPAALPPSGGTAKFDGLVVLPP